MGRKLDHAKALYLEGIRDGRAREAVTRYTGARYTQHSTGVADGVEGFVAFFEPFFERCPQRDIRIVRGFEDGRYVFVQAFQDINDGESRWVTADIFDTDDDDRIVEHWDVIEAFAPGMIDGPTEIEDLDRGEANKTLVRAFIERVLIGGQRAATGEFVRELTQHRPRVESDPTAFLDARAGTYRELHRLLGQGNFVASLSHVERDGDGWAVIDLFRVAGGKIVEHWDVGEKILPPEQWGNGGKF